MADNKKTTLKGVVTQKSDIPQKQNEVKGYGTVEKCESTVKKKPII